MRLTVSNDGKRHSHHDTPESLTKTFVTKTSDVLLLNAESAHRGYFSTVMFDFDKIQYDVADTLDVSISTSGRESPRLVFVQGVGACEVDATFARDEYAFLSHTYNSRIPVDDSESRPRAWHVASSPRLLFSSESHAAKRAAKRRKRGNRVWRQAETELVRVTVTLSQNNELVGAASVAGIHPDLWRDAVEDYGLLDCAIADAEERLLEC